MNLSAVDELNLHWQNSGTAHDSVSSEAFTNKTICI